MTEQDHRTAFEATISAPPFERNVARHADDATKVAWPGQYCDLAVQLAWEAWNAAIKHCSPLLAAANKVKEIRADLDDFDGDRRGHLYALDKAKHELVEIAIGIFTEADNE